MTDQEGDEAAGGGLVRLLAFSDGVFAIAITLLVLDLDVPSGLSSTQLGAQLWQLAPHVVGAALSFVVIGRFWLAHHQVFRYVHQADPVLLTLSVVLLAPIVLLPFSTALLADYGDLAVPTIIYSVTVAAVALLEIAVLIRGTRPTVAGHRRILPVRRIIAAAAVAAAGFLAAVPLALLSPDWAKLCWFAGLLPVDRFIRS